MEPLFVYGTLRRGFPHPMAVLLQKKSKYCGNAVIKGLLFDLGSYPGLVLEGKDAGEVHGDIYLIGEGSRLWSQLDNYEGVSSTYFEDLPYNRVKVLARQDDGKEVVAWTYIYTGDTASFMRIDSGNYLKYLNEEKF